MVHLSSNFTHGTFYIVNATIRIITTLADQEVSTKSTKKFCLQIGI